MNNQTKYRIAWLDIAKGIAILCTIIGHIVPFGSHIRNIIFSFHMPLFFVVSGYTIKQIPFSSLKSATFKDFKRLIIPFCFIKIIETFIGIIQLHVPVKECIYTHFLGFIWGNGCNYWKFPGIGAIWFFLTLFYSKLLFRVFLSLIKKNRGICLMFFSFLSILIGNKIWLPQNIDLIFPAMFFMYAGYIYKNNVQEDSKYTHIFGIIAFVIWTYMAWNKGVYIELATRHYPMYMICLLIALCGAFCIIQFSESIEELKISKPLIFLGKNSFDLLCIHHLDYSFSFLWYSISIPETSQYFPILPYIRHSFHIIIDISILVIWVFVVKKVIYKIKCNMNNKQLIKKE